MTVRAFSAYPPAKEGILAIIIAIVGIVFELLLGAVYCITVGSVAMVAIVVVAFIAIPCEIALQIEDCFARRPSP